MNLSGPSSADYQLYSYGWYMIKTGLNNPWRMLYGIREWIFSLGISINRIVQTTVRAIIGVLAPDIVIKYKPYTDRFHK